MNTKEDPIIVGALAGSVGTTVKEILAQLLVKRGVAPYDGIQKAASMLVYPYEIRTKKGTAVGILGDQVVGGTFGVIMSLLHRNQVVKINAANGVVFGLMTWMFMYGGLGGKVASIEKTSPQGALSAAMWHAIYGAITGGIICLADPNTAKSYLGLRNPKRSLMSRLRLQ